MSIESDIKTQLDGYSGLSSLISTRSYAVRMNSKPTYPNIVYSRIETEFSNTLTGRNALTNARFQFEVRAKTYTTMHNVIDQLINAMEAADFHADGFTALVESQEEVPFEDDVKVYRTDVDFSVWYQK